MTIILFGFAISLNFVPKGPVNKKPVLIQVIACFQTGDKPV